MKKYWTVFALSARFIFWPAAAITLLGALASAAVLLSQAGAGARLDSPFFNNAAVTALASVAAVYVVLLFPLRERGGSHPGYTLGRLSVSEFAVWLLQGLAGAMAIALCLLAQALACFYVGLGMQRAGAGVLGEVSLLAAFLGSQISHALLPLMDWPVYVRMGIVCCTFGLTASYSSAMSRRGQFSLTAVAVPLLGFVLMGFMAPVGQYGMELAVSIAGLAFCTGMGVSVAVRNEEEGLEAGLASADGGEANG